MNRQDAIKKVVKLIDRFHGSSNENEKATAKRQAKSLCEKHNITRQELWDARGGKPAYGADHQRAPGRPRPTAKSSNFWDDYYGRSRSDDLQRAKDNLRRQRERAYRSGLDDDYYDDEINEATMEALMRWLKDNPEVSDQLLNDKEFVKVILDTLDDEYYNKYYSNDYY